MILDHWGLDIELQHIIVVSACLLVIVWGFFYLKRAVKKFIEIKNDADHWVIK